MFSFFRKQKKISRAHSTDENVFSFSKREKPKTIKMSFLNIVIKAKTGIFVFSESF